ncbi:MAG: DUF559 domain-containing protein [Bacteroidaceae bacterium]|nr:DUF559 domain-containing protein [Bacteroidaceae bacterium]
MREPFRYETASPDRHELLRRFAFENRKKQTLAEQLLWECLRGERMSYTFRRQHMEQIEQALSDGE